LIFDFRFFFGVSSESLTREVGVSSESLTMELRSWSVGLSRSRPGIGTGQGEEIGINGARPDGILESA